MSIMPEGEQLKKALTWISEQRQDRPETSLFRIIEDACLKFDLPPKDEEFLLRFLAEKGSQKSKK
ncbi:MAG: hypothetical protein WA610_15035 [Thermodesulfovibrionales bacterium]